MKIIEDSLRDFWDNIKCTNIRIIGVPEELKIIEIYEKNCVLKIIKGIKRIEKRKKCTKHISKRR